MENWLTSIVSALIGAIIPTIGWIYQYRKDKKKEKQEEALRKSAMISARIVAYPKGRSELRIFNSGQSVARNVNVAVLTDTEGVYFSDFETYEISPQSNRIINIALCEGHTREVKFQFTWDDDYESNRSNAITLQL